jgi:hypothetical protein
MAFLFKLALVWVLAYALGYLLNARFTGRVSLSVGERFWYAKHRNGVTKYYSGRVWRSRS